MANPLASLFVILRDSFIVRWWKCFIGWLVKHTVALDSFSSLVQILSIPLLVIGYIQISSYFSFPDLHFRFTNVGSPPTILYRIENTERAVAELPRYWFTLFDLTIADPQPISFPIKEGSCIRPLSKHGPYDFDLVRNHRYFGIGKVFCKNCEHERNYWLHFIDGQSQDAWFAPFRGDEDSMKVSFLLQNPDLYIDQLVPRERRIPIGP